MSKAIYRIQFQSDWQSNRPNYMRLIIDYAKHALKPTVAFPYALIHLTRISTL